MRPAKEHNISTYIFLYTRTQTRVVDANHRATLFFLIRWWLNPRRKRSVSPLTLDDFKIACTDTDLPTTRDVFLWKLNFYHSEIYAHKHTHTVNTQKTKIHPNHPLRNIPVIWLAYTRLRIEPNKLRKFQLKRIHHNQLMLSIKNRYQIIYIDIDIYQRPTVDNVSLFVSVSNLGWMKAVPFSFSFWNGKDSV